MRLLRWLVLLVVGGTMIGFTAAHASRARSAAHVAAARHHRAVVEAQELAQLRRSDTLPARASRAEPALAPRVSATLARAGLSASFLTGFHADPPQAVGKPDAAPKIIRQRASLTIDGATLPMLGRFLQAWAQHEPDWTVMMIDLSPVVNAPAASVGGDLPLRAALRIETLFIDTSATETR